MKNDSRFLALFTNNGYKLPAESDIIISKAILCEQRKGNGVDYNWFATKTSLLAIRTVVLEAISNGMLVSNDAKTTGETVHTNYTSSVNGIVKPIGG